MLKNKIIVLLTHSQTHIIIADIKIQLIIKKDNMLFNYIQS
jgi:hypothetical protein